MRHVVILGDGMADEPIEELGGLTPLEAADTPSMDFMARHGRQGMLSTIPEGFHPGSEIANLAVLGYNLDEVFEGRGSLEAASMGVEIEPGEAAMRCNLICVSEGRIKNHSAGHISDEEAAELIGFLQERLGNDTVRFFSGISYRHLLKIRGADKRVSCTPPHDVPGQEYMGLLPVADVPEAEDTASLLRELILASQRILPEHPVNIRRREQGKDMANSIWPWSLGYRPRMRTLADIYGIRRGAVISAVDLIRGIGVYAGLEVLHVDGITGLYDTNYEGKAQAAIEALRAGCDFVYVHVEASDEAGHEGDWKLKRTTVEYLDKRLIAPILEAAPTIGDGVSIAVLPDHPTPCRIRTHSRGSVPFLIYNPALEPDSTLRYDERHAVQGVYGARRASEFMDIFLNDR